MGSLDRAPQAVGLAPPGTLHGVRRDFDGHLARDITVGVTAHTIGDGKEDALLDDKSPLWVDVRILTGEGKPAKEIPLKDGYFEVALPRAFFEGNPKSITLNWIDFYRG